jgi:uncharacterized protein YeaO (DUF488 family)
MIRIKRTYAPAERGDGRRVLVERLWPRGIKKTDLKLDDWCKEVAPSTELRQWFGHKPERWAEFRRRYVRELNANEAAWSPILDAARDGTVTLLYSAHDIQRNSAIVLRDYLNGKLARPTRRRATYAPSHHHA